MMLSAHVFHAYRGAVVLNNLGVSLLEKGESMEALMAFKHAATIMHMCKDHSARSLFLENEPASAAVSGSTTVLLNTTVSHIHEHIQIALKLLISGSPGDTRTGSHNQVEFTSLYFYSSTKTLDTVPFCGNPLISSKDSGDRPVFTPPIRIEEVHDTVSPAGGEFEENCLQFEGAVILYNIAVALFRCSQESQESTNGPSFSNSKALELLSLVLSMTATMGCTYFGFYNDANHTLHDNERISQSPYAEASLKLEFWVLRGFLILLQQENHRNASITFEHHVALQRRLAELFVMSQAWVFISACSVSVVAPAA